MTPLVSIIVPCYNQAEYLPETLESVLAQTYKNWECIIVNDGSIDDTEQVASQYTQKDKRFKYFHQQNGGVSKARNAAIANSCGEYILPLDGDDIIAPLYIEKAVQYFEQYPETKVVYCRVRLFGDEDKEWILTPYEYDNLLWCNQIFCTALFRRSDYDKTKGYDEQMREGLEDWDFWLSLLSSKDKVHQIDEVLFFYRIRGNSRNRTMDKHFQKLCQRIYMNHTAAYEKYLKDIIFFHEYKIIADTEKCNAVFAKELEIRSSTPYKIGKVILAPLKFIKNTIKIL